MDATTAEESFATILGNGSSWMSKKFNDFDFSFGRHLFRVRHSAAALPAPLHWPFSMFYKSLMSKKATGIIKSQF